MIAFGNLFTDFWGKFKNKHQLSCAEQHIIATTRSGAGGASIRDVFIPIYQKYFTSVKFKKTQFRDQLTKCYEIGKIFVHVPSL